MEPSANGAKPLADLIEEAERVIAAANEAKVQVRLTGGLAIRRCCPVAAVAPLARTYADLDLAIAAKERKSLTELMGKLGYFGDKIFNGLHGHQRLYFDDVEHHRHVDVFVDAVRMCHVIELKDRIGLRADILTPSDLLLTKLQIVELNAKDLLDLLSLLHDQEVVAGSNEAIDSTYLAKLWGSDWPIWRTSQLTLGKVRDSVGGILPAEGQQRVLAKVDALEKVLEEAPKSFGWKVRARVGDRMKWYELPEEVK